MSEVVPLPLGHRRALVRAAFSPVVPLARVDYRQSGRWSTAPPRIWSGTGGGERLVIIVPTVTHGVVPQTLDGGLRRIAEAAAEVTRADMGVRCLVAVALYEADERSADETSIGRALATELERTWQAWGSAVPFVALVVSEPSKVVAINCTAPLLDANEATAVAWFDDDVEVTPDCLTALLRAYDPGKTCVYGARVVPALRSRRPGKPGVRGALCAVAPNSYPYGCSMLMSRATFGRGIPPIYMSDDHYFPIWLLDPAAMDPLHRLRVVPDALVRVNPAPSLRVALRRVVRNYRNVQRVLADADAGSARYFRRRLQFPGLRAPQDLREALAPAFWARLTLQAGRAALWTALVAEVLLRGLLGRPRAAVWSSALRR